MPTPPNPPPDDHEQRLDDLEQRLTDLEHVVDITANCLNAIGATLLLLQQPRGTDAAEEAEAQFHRAITDLRTATKALRALRDDQEPADA